MSYHAQAWAMDQINEGKLEDTGEIVLLWLLAYCHNQETGQCNPSIAFLSQYSRMAERTVRYKLDALDSRQVITIVKRFAPSGRQVPNHYLLMGQTQDVVGEGAPGAGGRVHQVQGEGAKLLQGEGAAVCTPRISEQESEQEKDKKARKRAPKPAQVPIPEGWTPSEADKAYARGRGFSEAQTALLAENFADHHRKKGTAWADWSAAWRTWVRNEIKFHGKPKQAEKPRGKFDDLWDPAF